MNCENHAFALYFNSTMKMNGRSAWHWILVGISLVLQAGAAAQEAVISPPAGKLDAPVLRKAAPPTLSQPGEPADAFFSWGRLSLHPHLLGRAVYGMGLPAKDGRHVASMIYTMAPGLQLDLGQNWSADYTPTWTTYTAAAIEDTIDHSVRLSGAWEVQDWALSVSENYRKSSPLLIETGAQTPQRTWATDLSATRPFGTVLNFQANASLNERYGDSFPDTRDWATMNWLTVRFTPRLIAGLGIGAGYSDIVGEPDATFERYMSRLQWNPTEKLSMNLDAGVEARHSRAAGAEDQENPTYNAELLYRPFDVTQFSFGASSSVTNSYYQNQVTENTSWNFGLQQRLLEHFYLNAVYSHRDSEFSAVAPLTPVIIPTDPTAGPAVISLPGRSDQIKAFNVRLFTTLLKHWRIAATYAYSENHSSQALFTFDSTQFGLEISRRF